MLAATEFQGFNGEANPCVVVGDRLQALFLSVGRCQSVARHKPIYSPGDAAGQFFMVGGGEVRLSRYSNDGRELTLDMRGHGEVFGENGILNDTPRGCQAVARTDALVYTLDKEPLMKALEGDPVLSLELTRYLVRQQARMENRLETIVFRSAHAKVAHVLLALGVEHGIEVEDGVLIEYPITHQELANLIAVTRETVSYAFMEFRQMGLIATHRRQTILTDVDGLTMLAEE